MSANKKREDREQRFKHFGENFRAKLIGIDPVEDARGDNMCLASMAKLKALVKASGEHKQQIIINVSLEGIKIIDLKTLTNLHTHEVIKISFISRDPSDKRAFGYVYGEAGNHKFFAIKTQNQADELVLALKDLFEIVLANKQKEVAEQKKRMEETTVYLQPSYDNPLGSPTSKAPAENVYSESPVAKPAEPAQDNLVSLESQVSNLQMGITAMEQLDLNAAEPDPFSPNAATPVTPTNDPFAPAPSGPPQQPPPPLRPPQAAPRAAPRLAPPVAAVVETPAAAPAPVAAPAATEPSGDLFGEAPAPVVTEQSKPSDDLFKEFKDTFSAPPQPAAASTNPFGGGGMGGGFGMTQPAMGGFQQQPAFGQMPMGMGQQPIGMGQQPMGMGQQPMGMGQQPMGMGMGMAPMGMQQQQQPQQDLFGGTTQSSSNSFDAFTLQPQQVHPKPVEKNGGPAKKPDPFGDIAVLGSAPTDAKDPKKKDPFAGFKMAKPGEVKVPEFSQSGNTAASNGAASGNAPSLSLDLAKSHDISEEFSLPSPQGPPPPLPTNILSQGVGISLNLDDVGDIPPPPPRRSRSSVPSEGSPLPVPLRTNLQSPVSPSSSTDSHESESALRTTLDTTNTSLTIPSLTRNPSSSPSNLASLANDGTNVHGSGDGLANAASDLNSTHSNSMGNLSSLGHGLSSPTEQGKLQASQPSPISLPDSNSLTISLPTDFMLSSRQSPLSSHQSSSLSVPSQTTSSKPTDSTRLSPLSASIGSQDVLSSSAPVSDSFFNHRYAHASMTSSASNPLLSKITVPILPVTDDPFADDPFLRGSPTVKKVFVLPQKFDPHAIVTSVPACTGGAFTSASFSSTSFSSPSQQTNATTTNSVNDSNGSNGVSGVWADPFSIGGSGGQSAPKAAGGQPLFDDSPFGAFDFSNPDKN
ncbi:disabled homolog 1-like [Acanthaster planci]|uniref:Disabled homolog 1-like n=1 Tax=Acanthaster planci TaxID=133434 RepID=A0A8B7ZAC0_ACAPL|nr:disabled homolog 1-like [Acanthaster planci]XP_022101765.1 disabled homolog 1-like [Acanthaster planci]